MHQLLFCAALSLFALNSFSGTNKPAGGPPPGLRRIAAAQPGSRLIDFRLSDPREVLARIEQSLTGLKHVIKSEDRDAILLWTKVLNDATKHLAEVMMNRSVREALAAKNIDGL